MRCHFHRAAAFVSFGTSITLFCLTMILVFEPLEDMTEENSDDKVIDDHKNQSNYYQPLSNTDGLWTIYDIRKGIRSSNLTLIGVTDNNDDIAVDILDNDEIKPSSRNRTRDTNILVYNRVPKCASTSMQNILRQLSRANHFRYESSNIYWK